MAKFFYRMQNILDIKYKLEETAKQEYANARFLLTQEEEKLNALHGRKQGYYEEYQKALVGSLDFLKLEELSNAMDLMDDLIKKQDMQVKKRSKELEQARLKMNHEMQERKMHEKLKEKAFEQYLIELNEQEAKETDEVVSYQFRNTGIDSEE